MADRHIRSTSCYLAFAANFFPMFQLLGLQKELLVGLVQ